MHQKRDLNFIGILSKIRTRDVEEDVEEVLRSRFISNNSTRSCTYISLHKNWSFSLRISSVNVTKSAGNCGLVTFTEEILNEKLHFCPVFADNVPVDIQIQSMITNLVTPLAVIKAIDKLQINFCWVQVNCKTFKIWNWVRLVIFLVF